MTVDPIADFEREIRDFLQRQGVAPERITLTVPPEPEFGEAASNAAFLLASERRQNPREIAAKIAAAFQPGMYRFIARVEAAGAGFLNFYLDYDAFGSHVLRAVETSGALYGRPEGIKRERILIEHTSVNPNKEWHVGHLRNAVLGDVVVRVARLVGHEVEVQNYIDDTGRQAAEALEALHVLSTPPQDGEKYDHYVGRLYVEINARLSALPALREELAKLEREGADGRRVELERQCAELEKLQQGVEEMLHELEKGGHRKTIERILDAQLQTATRLGIFYDLLVWESDIVRANLLQQALDLLRQSPRVYIPSSGPHAGALVIELPEPATAKKRRGGDSNDAAQATAEREPNTRVLVRSNGIPTYTGKDIAYMMWKFGLLPEQLRICPYRLQANGQPLATTCPDGTFVQRTPPDEVINVVAEHQALQQQTVIEALRAAGYEQQAEHAHHLSYGMVSQAGSRISGRRGVGSSADDVITEAVAVAHERVREKQPALSEEERAQIAEAIGIGAIRYLMVQYNPVKAIEFNIEDVVSFEGNTGLYLQYALVRMHAILRKAREEFGLDESAIRAGDAQLLTSKQERELILRLARFPSAIADAMRTLNVNLVADYAHSLASTFSQFYRDCPVLSAEPEVRMARLHLVLATRDVLCNAANVLGVPIVERL